MKTTFVLLFALCIFIVPNIAIKIPSKLKINKLMEAKENVTTTGSTCGGNCPSGDCPSCLCGTTKNPQDISDWCSKYSWGQSCCKCIVSHESGGNANAENYNSNGSYDIGLWQINDVNWDSCSGGKAPCDPSTNLACAKDVYKWGGNTWKLWSTCSTCGCCNSN